MVYLKIRICLFHSDIQMQEGDAGALFLCVSSYDFVTQNQQTIV